MERIMEEMNLRAPKELVELHHPSFSGITPPLAASRLDLPFTDSTALSG